jgi:hypothetical protein
MGNSESNESAAVKRQAEGGANPMYTLLDLSGSRRKNRRRRSGFESRYICRV